MMPLHYVRSRRRGAMTTACSKSGHATHTRHRCAGAKRPCYVSCAVVFWCSAPGIAQSARWPNG